MGRGGNKLTKLKSVLKKLKAFGHRNRHHRTIRPTPSFTPSSSSNNSEDIDGTSSSSTATDLRPVYVGQSRRRYLVRPAVVRHPLFRELAARSGNGAPSSDGDAGSPSLSIACEVVLFDHLLWMLGNAESRLESLDELVEFYVC